ncbi:cysteine desulfurase [Georgenia yuyongxinii]|uniref:cysteine desulfurase n=1 Tax=Georgenia yuyongxinii TaxID=2589797 RepID=A0A5B8C4D9_9MICO|nr:cysteine desulfurase family protein [Georgenia yuyongxinii]QDC25444.1 cysteine desulfurase [Georgenia yuyongxinii]
MSGTRHYLDHAATTAVRPEVAAVYAEELTRLGNPSSLHAAGREARRRLEEAREQLAAALGAEPAEVLFTSGGTEADNLAVKGAFWAGRGADPRRTRLAISAVEHHAVLEAGSWLAAHDGAELDVLGVGDDGVLDVAALERHLAAHGQETALVSVMWANNETGVLQPVERVVALAHAAGVPVHSDAVQAVGHVTVRFDASGLDALSLSGHKLGAPVGTGALLARRGLALAPVEHGGGQERGVRSGTLAVAGARALALAVSAAVAEHEAEAVRLRELRGRLVAAALTVPGVHLTGPADDGARLPGTTHLTVEGADADALLFGLDMAGIDASSGSACQAGVHEASHVLLAMGHTEEQARSAVRFSLGRTTTAADVDAAVAVLAGVVENARRAHATRRAGSRPVVVTAAGTPADRGQAVRDAEDR